MIFQSKSFNFNFLYCLKNIDKNYRCHFIHLSNILINTNNPNENIKRKSPHQTLVKMWSRIP